MVVVGDLRGEPPTTKASLPGGQAAGPKRASRKFREYSYSMLAHLVSEPSGLLSPCSPQPM